MIRDEELNRLIRYAQGMGLSVRFKPYVPYSKTAAEWTLDGTEITVYTTTSDSKLDKILSLIHEIGHHKGFVANDRQIDPKFEEALDDEKKRSRGRVLASEIADTEYWEEIYRDTNCQFNIEKLHKQKEFDIWCYEVYYDKGKFPTKKARKEKKKQLRNKYKC